MTIKLNDLLEYFVIHQETEFFDDLDTEDQMALIRGYLLENETARHKVINLLSDEMQILFEKARSGEKERKAENRQIDRKTEIAEIALPGLLSRQAD